MMLVGAGGGLGWPEGAEANVIGLSVSRSWIVDLGLSVLGYGLWTLGMDRVSHACPRLSKFSAQDVIHIVIALI
ncbi:hypothetical protein BTW08_13455 [Salinicola sp. MH3R3-1]|nr:hypothetical protein BTW08_13455 [Salinicola sp. MH3R3-1]